MDCSTAQERLELVRLTEQELASPEFCDVAHHLEECAECLAVHRTRQANDARIVRAMHDLPVPEGLRERLLEQLGSSPPTRTHRRGWRWYWTGGAVAVAASLLVAFSLWVGRPQSNEPTAVTAAAVSDADAFGTPTWQSWPRDLAQTPAAITAYFNSKLGLIASPPTRLPASRLVALGKTTFGGRPVATLRYDLGQAPAPATLSVYVLPSTSFRVTGINTLRPVTHNSAALSIAVWSEQGFVYVAVHEGPADRWRGFVEPRQRDLT